MLILILFTLVLRSVNVKAEEEQLPTHILFILADDLGWSDVSFHGFPQIPTPNIDALAANSIILNNYYSESLCSRARASLMSGNYPIHTGLQHSEIKSGEPTGLPLDIMIMPEHLKNKGYKTYMIGKWHLGYSNKEYTPTKRGFDSFFGFYNEQIDYFDYTNFDRYEDLKDQHFYGIDLQKELKPREIRGRYATDVFTEKALDIISSHNDSVVRFFFNF
ncbi:arylsulfatase B [Caerostris extrusa]|uniref:Arylsulfatase B n=1 Tax=Caerostris extrusa TaxID=172846 RepID=A0AAV4WFG6_CAEEX|nr:arylsulfatase B [Caerostris extrusa]